MDILIPDMYQKSIYSINYEKLYESGIRCLLFDLDNTCVPYTEKKPSQKLIELFNYLKEYGFKVILFSNATKKRLEIFKNTLIVDCSYSSKKPSKRKFLKILKIYNFDLSEVAIIGDQLFTDILGGNRVGIKTILVNPMSKKDMPLTYLFRMIEKIEFKKFKKRGILVLGDYYE